MRGHFTKLALGALIVAAPIAAFAGPDIPETCDILQNILCDDPIAWIRAVVEDLLR